MRIQKEVNNRKLANVLRNIDEKELLCAIEYYLNEVKPQRLKVGKRKPFRSFKAVKLAGSGPNASAMVIQDRY